MSDDRNFNVGLGCAILFLVGIGFVVGLAVAVASSPWWS